MEELFTYYDMFASKGPEYLIIIVFLIIVLVVRVNDNETRPGEAGVDIASPAFWQGGFDVLENMLAELARLA